MSTQLLYLRPHPILFSQLLFCWLPRLSTPSSAPVGSCITQRVASHRIRRRPVTRRVAEGQTVVPAINPAVLPALGLQYRCAARVAGRAGPACLTTGSPSHGFSFGCKTSRWARIRLGSGPTPV